MRVFKKPRNLMYLLSKEGYFENVYFENVYFENGYLGNGYFEFIFENRKFEKVLSNCFFSILLIILKTV